MKVTEQAIEKAIKRVVDAAKEAAFAGSQHPEDRPAIEAELDNAELELRELWKHDQIAERRVHLLDEFENHTSIDLVKAAGGSIAYVHAFEKMVDLADKKQGERIEEAVNKAIYAIYEGTSTNLEYCFCMCTLIGVICDSIVDRAKETLEDQPELASKLGFEGLPTAAELCAVVGNAAAICNHMTKEEGREHHD